MEEEISKEKLKDKESKTTKNVKEVKSTKPTKKNKEEKNEEKLSEVSKGQKREETSLKVSKKQELAIPKVELEEIQKEIKNETIIPKEKKNELYKKVFDNIISAIVILVYFIFIYIIYMIIEKVSFEIILKTSSMIFIISTIGIFEYAYKKESGKYTIEGIEMLVVSITTIILMQIYKLYSTKLTNSITIIAVAFSIYYIVKSIISYIKYKKEIRKQANNIYRTTKRNEVK